jgi:hypothetical protein
MKGANFGFNSLLMTSETWRSGPDLSALPYTRKYGSDFPVRPPSILGRFSMCKVTRSAFVGVAVKISSRVTGAGKGAGAAA